MNYKILRIHYLRNKHYLQNNIKRPYRATTMVRTKTTISKRICPAHQEAHMMIHAPFQLITHALWFSAVFWLPGDTNARRHTPSLRPSSCPDTRGGSFCSLATLALSGSDPRPLGNLCSWRPLHFGSSRPLSIGLPLSPLSVTRALSVDFSLSVALAFPLSRPPGLIFSKQCFIASLFPAAHCVWDLPLTGGQWIPPLPRNVKDPSSNLTLNLQQKTVSSYRKPKRPSAKCPPPKYQNTCTYCVTSWHGRNFPTRVRRTECPAFGTKTITSKRCAGANMAQSRQRHQI